MKSIFFVIAISCSHFLVGQTVQFVDGLNNTPIREAIAVINGDSVETNWNGEVMLSAKDSLNIRISGYETNLMTGQDLGDQIIFIPMDLILDEMTISVGRPRKTVDIAASVSQLGKHTISKATPFMTTSVFDAVPGVFIHNGALNTNRIVIRGVGSRTPFSTNRIRAYYENIPLTDGEGTSIIEDIDLDLIRKIEVIKGTSSSLYGSGLGGVIRLFAPNQTAQGLRTSLGASFGSFNTSKYHFSLGYRKAGTQVLSKVSHTKSDGYRDNNEYRRLNALLNTKWSVKKTSFSALLNYVNLNAQIPSSLNQTDYSNNPRKAADNWKAVNGFEDYERVLLGINIDHQLTRLWSIKTAFYGTSFNQYESRPFNILDDESLGFGNRTTLSYQKKVFHTHLGIEYFREDYEQELYNTNEGQQGSLLSSQEQLRTYVNLFFFGQLRLSNHWQIETAINLNKQRYELLAATDQSTSSYSYPMLFSPRLGINFKYSNNGAMYSSIGHGFSPPSVEETLFPEGMINTSIMPEEGYTLDIAAKQKLKNGDGYINIGLYYTWLSNLLVNERFSEAINIGVNAGKTRLRGAELALQYPITNGASLFEITFLTSANLSQNVFEDFVDNGTDLKGKSLPGIPSFTSNTGLDWNFKKVIGGSLQYRVIGQQYITDANDIAQPGYQLLNQQVWYAFQKTKTSLRLSAGVNNLLNKPYPSMLLVNAGSFGGNAPRYFYPGQSRNFYISFKANF